MSNSYQGYEEMVTMREAEEKRARDPHLLTVDVEADEALDKELAKMALSEKGRAYVEDHENKVRERHAKALKDLRMRAKDVVETHRRLKREKETGDTCFAVPHFEEQLQQEIWILARLLQDLTLSIG